LKIKMAKRYGKTKRVYSAAQINRINRKYSKGPQGGGGSGGSVLKDELAALAEAGGGGGGQPSLSGSHSYDTEFGYLVAYLPLQPGLDFFNNANRDQRNFGRDVDGLDMFSNSIMTDADYATVMSDATHITFIVGANGEQDNAPGTFTNGIVYTKAQIVTDPNVTTVNTASADRLMRETYLTTDASANTWHDEDVGTDGTGSDASRLGVASNKLVEYGQSSKGYNNVARYGGTLVTDHYEYTGNWITVWVTNSGVAPVLS
jgi:hypothetical protein